jgi:hypothetical protein
MTPAGYLAKRVCMKPDWLRAPQVTDIYSVSGCVSEVFDDYVDYWKHNGFWLQPPLPTFVLQLQEARAEWRRRHPPTVLPDS